MTQNFYIGYFNLEEWAEWTKANAAKQINACLSHVQTNTRLDIAVETSQIWDGQAHYCHIPVASIAYLNGQPFHAEAHQRHARAAQAWGIVEAWLIEAGFQLRNAAISKPGDHAPAASCQRRARTRFRPNTAPPRGNCPLDQPAPRAVRRSPSWPP